MKDYDFDPIISSSDFKKNAKRMQIENELKQADEKRKENKDLAIGIIAFVVVTTIIAIVELW